MDPQKTEKLFFALSSFILTPHKCYYKDKNKTLLLKYDKDNGRCLFG